MGGGIDWRGERRDKEKDGRRRDDGDERRKR